MPCLGSEWSRGTWISWWGSGCGRGWYRGLNGSYACWRFVGPHTCRRWPPRATSIPNSAACQSLGESWHPVVSWWLCIYRVVRKEAARWRHTFRKVVDVGQEQERAKYRKPGEHRMWLGLLLRIRLREWLVGCGDWGSPGSMQACCCVLRSGEVSGVGVCVVLCRRPRRSQVGWRRFVESCPG